MRKDIRKAVCSRELSWLRFNTRVLEEAEDSRLPLMERLMFRNIYSTNLDEFCRTRMGKLLTLSLSDNGLRDVRTDMHPAEQLERISIYLNAEQPRADHAFLSLEKQLEAHGVKRVTYKDRPVGSDAELLSEIFRREYSEKLTPLIVHHDSERPVLENGKVYAVFHLNKDHLWSIGIIDCSALPPLTEISADGELRYILTDELVLHFAQQLFPEYSVLERTTLRITRSAFMDVEPAYAEGADTIEKMSEFMDNRESLIAVRTQLSRNIPPILRYRLLERLSLDDSMVTVSETPLSPMLIPELYSRMRGFDELYYKKYEPSFPRALLPGEQLETAAQSRDILLNYPYESMEPFLQMLERAAEDDSATSIKITLYRLAENSRIAAALCNAARSGKEVFVCMELRARFSERENIAYARSLRAAGCRVICGVPGYKVHSKLCRIDRIADGKTVKLTQIGTGNYNESTARQYTDFSLVTTDEGIAADADSIFASLEGLELPPETGALTTSPLSLKKRLISLIDMEIAAANAGEPAYFGAKLNGLSDPDIIEKLTEASAAGVKIELVVRGICCIIPGVSGLTENITVRSIVDRYLEHARIYIFGTGAGRIVYISSADLMTRNTERRVESAVRINDTAVAERVCGYFEAQLNDTAKARIMQPDGSYLYTPKDEISSQEALMSDAPAPEPVQTVEPEPEPPQEREAELAPEPVRTIGSEPEPTPEPDPVTPVSEDIKPEAPVKKSLWARIVSFFKRKK